MTTNNNPARRELLLACRDAVQAMSDQDILALLDDHDDPAAIAEDMVLGMIETDADDDIESPFTYDEDLAIEVVMVMLEMRLTLDLNDN